MRKLVSLALAFFVMAALAPALPADAATMDRQVGVDLPYEGLSMVKNGDGLIGFADESGKMVIPCRFDNASPFKYGIALVSLDGKSGFIDKTGKFVIEPKYDWISISGRTSLDGLFLEVTYFENGPLVFTVNERDPDHPEWTVGQKSGLLSLSGEVLPAQYDSIGELRNGVFIVSKDGKYGAVRVDGTFAVPVRYESLSHLDLNAPVGLLAGVGGKYGVLSCAGGVLLPLTYEKLEYLRGGLFSFSYGGRSGVMDISGKVLVYPAYDEIKSYNGGLAAVRKGSKWGYLDAFNWLVTELIYDEVITSYDDFAVAGVRIGDKWGFVDPMGRLSAPVLYDQIDSRPNNGLIHAVRDGKSGFLTPSGEVAVPFEYDGLAGSVPGGFAMNTKAGVRLIDTQGRSVTDTVYSEVERTSFLIYSVRQGDQWGCVDASGKTVVAFEYDEISETGKNWAIARKGDKYGAVSWRGDVLIPFEHIALTPYSFGRALAVVISPDADPEKATWDDLIVVDYMHPDFLPSHWAGEQVEKARLSWLVPDLLQMEYTSSITRREYCWLAAYLVQAGTGISYKRIEAPQSFDDASEVFINAMASIGVVSGVGGGKFAPDREITREEAAVMLEKIARYLGVSPAGLPAKYADSNQFSSWAADSVAFVTQAGIMSGEGGGRFNPNGHFTREQAIVTMYKLYQLMKARV